MPGTDAFNAGVSDGPRLELARGDSTRPSDDVVQTRAAPSAGSLRDIGATTSSGVAINEDPGDRNLVRCAQHGLYYDKTKASGCRKCMSMFGRSVLAALAGGIQLAVAQGNNANGRTPLQDTTMVRKEVSAHFITYDFDPAD